VGSGEWGVGRGRVAAVVAEWGVVGVGVGASAWAEVSKNGKK
jgi:hypothetical protein